MANVLDLLTDKNNVIKVHTADGYDLSIARFAAPKETSIQVIPVYYNFADGRPAWRILANGSQIIADTTGKALGYCSENHVSGDTQRWDRDDFPEYVALIEKASKESFVWGKELWPLKDEGTTFYTGKIDNNIMRKEIGQSGRIMIGVLVPYSLVVIDDNGDLHDLNQIIQFRSVVNDGEGTKYSKGNKTQFTFEGVLSLDNVS